VSRNIKSAETPIQAKGNALSQTLRFVSPAGAGHAYALVGWLFSLVASLRREG